MEHYRISSEAAVYFVTFTVVDWLPVFVSEQACQIITNSLNFCHEQKELRVNAYVVMPTHFHAIVFDGDFNSDRLTQTLTDMRKFTGRQLSDFCSQRMPLCFADTLREQSTADRARRLWQPTRHPEAILSYRFWRQKFDYLHDNPVRKGLVFAASHWRFSSAGFYAADGEIDSDLRISPIEW